MSIVYVVRTVVQPEHEDEWLRWQDSEHVTNLLQLQGYLGVHRFHDAERPQHYLNLWRIAGRAAQSSDAYRRASLTPWFDRIRPFYDVSVTFGVEPEMSGDDSWRRKVRAAVIERRAPDGPLAPAAADAMLASEPSPSPPIVRVVALAPLAGDERSADSTVRVSFLGTDSDVPQHAEPGIERRRYVARGPYLAAQ